MRRPLIYNPGPADLNIDIARRGLGEFRIPAPGCAEIGETNVDEKHAA